MIWGRGVRGVWVCVCVCNKLFICVYISNRIIINHMGNERSRPRSSRPHNKWSNDAPKSVGDRTAVLQKCGRRCFLGPGTSFPICARLGSAAAAAAAGGGDCKIDRRGVQAAYSRAREWAAITARKKRSSVKAARAHRKYTAVARKAKSILSKMK